MKAVITVIGKDTVGVVARISAVCSKLNINIEDMTQSIMQEMFCMIMLVDVSESAVAFADLAGCLEQKGGEMNLSIRIQREDIFNAMHRI